MALNSVYLALFSLLPAMAIATTLRHQIHHQHGVKSMHFTLYQHDFFNKTDFIIVNGVAGAPFSQTTTPFGTFSTLQDNLTTTADPASEVVGLTEAIVVTSSFDGLDSLSVSKMTLNLKAHKGSISIVGVANAVKASDLPVVGGTGDFLFVQGYVTSSPVSFQGFNSIYKVEFHLYWPPYAALIKG